MKKLKKFINHSIFKLFWGFMAVGSFLTGIFLLLSNRYDLMGWTNSLTLTTGILIALLWLSFANSKGVFDMLVFGVKSFLNGFKKDYEKLDYYEYTTNKNVPTKSYYISLSLVTLIFTIITIILLVLVL